MADDELAKFLGEISEVEKSVSVPAVRAPASSPPPNPANAPVVEAISAKAVPAEDITARLERIKSGAPASTSPTPATPPPLPAALKDFPKMAPSVPLPPGQQGVPNAPIQPIGGLLGGNSEPRFIRHEGRGVQDKSKLQARCLRVGGDGHVWEDPSMAEWPDDDYRLFVGNLGNDVNGDILGKAFAKYESFLKAKVVRDRRTLKSKGFGFVSFRKAEDKVRAMREMAGKYIGNRPVVLKSSKWTDRQADDPKEAAKILKIQKSKRSRKYHYGGVAGDGAVSD